MITLLLHVCKHAAAPQDDNAVVILQEGISFFHSVRRLFTAKISRYLLHD